nr:hypothetical protein [uncultured Cohaesibacter sp.]
MGDGYNFKQLSQAILSMSKATDWETARKEWVLVDVIEADEPETCLCSHYPIIEICEIRNRVTGHTTEVGNVCVKRFLGVRSDLIFTGIKRIRKDIEKSLNADSIAFFHQRGLLNNWEYQFLQNTMRKRNLTFRQMETRRQINQKVLSALSRRGFQGQSV